MDDNAFQQLLRQNADASQRMGGAIGCIGAIFGVNLADGSLFKGTEGIFGATIPSLATPFLPKQPVGGVAKIAADIHRALADANLHGHQTLVQAAKSLVICDAVTAPAPHVEPVGAGQHVQEHQL